MFSTGKKERRLLSGMRCSEMRVAKCGVMTHLLLNFLLKPPFSSTSLPTAPPDSVVHQCNSDPGFCTLIWSCFVLLLNSSTHMEISLPQVNYEVLSEQLFLDLHVKTNQSGIPSRQGSGPIKFNFFRHKAP